MKNLLLLLITLFTINGVSQTILVSNQQQYLTNDVIDFYMEDHSMFILSPEDNEVKWITEEGTSVFDVVADTLRNGIISLYCHNKDGKNIIIDLFFDELDNVTQITIMAIKEENGDLLEIRFLTKDI